MVGIKLSKKVWDLCLVDHISVVVSSLALKKKIKIHLTLMQCFTRSKR